MDASDELEEKGLLDFLVAVDGREEGLCHVVVFLGVAFDLVDVLHGAVGELGDDVLPYRELVELLLDVVLVLLHLLLLPLELVELVVLHLYVDGHEDQLVAQVPHPLYPSDPSLRVRDPSSLVAPGGQLRLLSGLEHAGDLGQHAEVPDDFADVSRLSLLSELVAQDDVDRPRHGARWNLGRVFLHPDLLEVSEGALRHLQFPGVPVAVLSTALLRLRVLELLDDLLADLPARPALEDPDLQLRPHFRRPRDRSFQLYQFAEVLALEASNAILESLLVAVVEAALVGVLGVLLALAIFVEDGLLILEHELGECLIDDWLELVVLVEDEPGQVRVVVDEVSEREHDVVARVVNRILGSDQIFRLPVLSPFLDKLRESFLYRVP